MDSPEHARIARNWATGAPWFYDSPAICADVWMQLARAADRTERIGLGGEGPGSPRAIDAAGHAASLWLHFGREFGGLDTIPNGEK